MHRKISENKVRVCFVMNCYLLNSFFPKTGKEIMVAYKIFTFFDARISARSLLSVYSEMHSFPGARSSCIR